MVAATGGWQGLPDFEDPADLLAGLVPEGESVRAADPDARAAQVAAFLASIN